MMLLPKHPAGPA